IGPHFPGTRVEKYVIMPNHLHMILSVGCDGKAPAGGIYAAPTVPRIISAYKASVSREAGFAVWQRSFYDHIIRNRSDFEQIWQYIDNNPLNWLLQGKTGTPDTNDVF
ncbi:MAG: transposase, partial [Gemmiger sp.]|nr:transposase [Gemmiger sp.]